MTLIGSSAAPAPQPQKPADEPEVKLPALLAGKPLKEDPKDDELRKLLKARYNEALGEAREYYELRGRPFVCLRGDPDDLYEPWQRLVQARLEVCDSPPEKVALLTQYVEMTKEAEKYDQVRYDAGRVPITILHRARYERLDAELKLLRAKREADKVKDK